MGVSCGMLSPATVTGKLADKPTRRQPSRPQTNSLTLQLADKPTRQK